MRYLFEDCSLDPDRREFRRAGERIELEPQVFDLLVFLVRNRDRVASRDDLLEAVWRGRIVSESTLSSRINAARVAVGDDGASQRVIRTLPRKGVRFVAEVQEESDPIAPPPRAPAPPLPITRPPANVLSVAVLPFANMSGGEGDDYFADGMTEEITTGLAQCSGLTVVARTSCFAYKGRFVDVRQVGVELGATYLLEGSVRRSDKLLRITAQLIDARSGAHLWADKFEGDFSDVFKLQDQITQSVVSVIEPKLLFAEADRARRNAPQNVDAYDLYLRALSLSNEYTPDAIMGALQCLDQALEIDPGYAQAMAASACYRGLLRFQGWTAFLDEPKSKGVQLAWDAVTQAPNDAHVLWMSGFAIWILGEDGARAQGLLRRSLAINQNSEIATSLAGWIEAANGDTAGARALFKKAILLNPSSPSPWIALAGMAFTEIVEGAYADAVGWAEQAVAQNHRFAMGLRCLAVALVKTGQTERARRAVGDILKIEPGATVESVGEGMSFVNGPVLRTFTEGLGEAGLPDLASAHHTRLRSTP
jgi:TolB-like protein/Flp pilus assembly protein TadD